MSAVDYLGLTLRINWEGCRKDQIGEFEKGLAELCAKTFKCKSCVEKYISPEVYGKQFRKLKGICAGNIEIDVFCDNDRTDPWCKENPDACGGGVEGGKSAVICKRALTDVKKNCNGSTFGCLLFHETMHMAGWRSNGHPISTVETCNGCPSSSDADK